MNTSFIALEAFEYEVYCHCPESHIFHFQPGDVITLENEKRYVDDMGWYFLIDINNERQAFMFLEDLEDLYTQGTVCSLADLQLRQNYLRFKLDEALDQKDKEAFLSCSSELNHIAQLLAEMKQTPQLQLA